jgi:hypothetical protein
MLRRLRAVLAPPALSGRQGLALLAVLTTEAYLTAPAVMAKQGAAGMLTAAGWCLTVAASVIWAVVSYWRAP